MATLAASVAPSRRSDDRFFLFAAVAMTVVMVAGFSVQLAAGRSTFSAPLLVHAHAIVFMGWVTLYLFQNIFATTGRLALHRRLGWIATGWIAAMLILGCSVTVAMARRGQVPFFFRPLHFLVFDPLSLFTFVGLTTAAIVMRRRTDWHRRLHFDVAWTRLWSSAALAVCRAVGLGGNLCRINDFPDRWCIRRPSTGR
jgi:hypothetical protein